jgi:hypothetical protein
MADISFQADRHLYLNSVNSLVIRLLTRGPTLLKINRHTDKQTDKQTNRQTDEQTDRQTNRQTDRQTN